MPKRLTKRGDERTPLGGTWDVIVCGASFAGLTVARQLAGSGARVLVLDRYEIGERATSACAAPAAWLEALGLEDTIRQTFPVMVVHTPHGTGRMRMPLAYATFDYQALCAKLWAGCEAEFETATVVRRLGRAPGFGAPVRIETDRGELSAPLVVDCLGWRRVLGDGYQPPEAPLSRGLEVHPHGASDEFEVWIDRSYVPAGYGWSFPASGEVRVGVGSFDPRYHVKEPTVQLAEDLEHDAVRYQGNWIPHRIRQATDHGVFFVGDSAGHCLPATAEGIRTAFYFAVACGNQLREVIAGERSRREALQAYDAFSASHERKFKLMLRIQRLLPRIPPRLLGALVRAFSRDRFTLWTFGRYQDMTPLSYVREHAIVPEAQRPASREVARGTSPVS
jgi:menaquinone-9 beta-reductase